MFISFTVGDYRGFKIKMKSFSQIHVFCAASTGIPSSMWLFLLKLKKN